MVNRIQSNTTARLPQPAQLSSERHPVTPPPTEKKAAEESGSIWTLPHHPPTLKSAPATPFSGSKTLNALKHTTKSFAAFNDPKEEGDENPFESPPRLLLVPSRDKHNDSNDSSDQNNDSLLMIQSKLEQLDQLCKSGLLAAQAQELAIQAVLCVNAATIAHTKTTRDLKAAIGQMLQKLAQGGIGLPADAQSLLNLLKTQSTKHPLFSQTRLEDKDNITGHLLPLLLLALRQHSPNAPVLEPGVAPSDMERKVA